MNEDLHLFFLGRKVNNAPVLDPNPQDALFLAQFSRGNQRSQTATGKDVLAHCFQHLDVQPVDPHGAIGPHAHQPDIAQRRQMMRYGRLFQIQQLGQFADAPLLAGQITDDL